MWDVIVVGARPAGAATALRFARAGRAVLVLDKARPGTDTLSTHVLVPPAVARLGALGLGDALLATGAPPVRTMLIEFDGEAHPRAAASGAYSLSVRRPTLDPILAGAAADAGATLRHEVTVDALLRAGERVVGVRGRDAAGQPFAERARLVVGADGRHSSVARLGGAAEYNILECPHGAIYAYLRGVGPTSHGADVLQYASGPGCDSLCCPCDGDLHLALLVVDNAEFARINAAGPAAYLARLRTVPTLAPRLHDAAVASHLFAAASREMRGYFRTPYGPGWALVGDAAYYAHPAAANGIADALRSAELVHTLVERAWGEGREAEAHLAEYQETRDAENTGPFHGSYAFGRVNPFADPAIATMVRQQSAAAAAAAT